MRELYPIRIATAGAVLALAGCASESEPVATLTPEQHSNLKLASATHIKDLLAPYTAKQIYSEAGELSAYSWSDLTVEDEDFGGTIEYSDSSSVDFIVSISPDGAQLTVSRDSVDYCVDPATDDIIDADKCSMDSSENYIDTGYEATYLNPDITTVDPEAKLSLKDVRAFIKDEDTYITSVGDTYGNVLRIDQDGAVTEDGYIRGDISSQEETVRTLSDIVNHP